MSSFSTTISPALLEHVKSRARDAHVPVSAVVSAALTAYLQPPMHTLFQISTSGSLVEGVADGAVTCGQLLRHGDFGLGTFASLDGEMVALEGRTWRARSGGLLSEASPDDQVPFATVVPFAPSIDEGVTGLSDIIALHGACDAHRRSDNMFYAMRLDGQFEYVNTRAVSPPKAGGLSNAADSQVEHRFDGVKGSLVGIYSPSFSSAFSIAGYHFHFLTADRSGGGHVLDLSAASLRLRAEELHDFHLALPENEQYLSADLSQDPSAALTTAEQ